MLCLQYPLHRRAPSCSCLCQEGLEEVAQRMGHFLIAATRLRLFFSWSWCLRPLYVSVCGRTIGSGILPRETTLTEHLLYTQHFPVCCMCLCLHCVTIGITKDQKGSRIRAHEPPSDLLFNQPGPRVFPFSLWPWHLWVCFNGYVTEATDICFLRKCSQFLLFSKNKNALLHNAVVFFLKY